MQSPTKRHLLAGGLLLTLALSTACSAGPSPKPVKTSGGSLYAWARQVIPVLYGRKARGWDEVKAVADLALAVGKGDTVRSLAEDPEYVDRWSEFFVETLKVNRETEKSQADCFAPHIGYLPTPNDNGSLARFILGNGPGQAAPGCAGKTDCFNMSDVLRSALAEDDLRPIYLTYLFPMLNKPRGGFQGSESERRGDVWSTFETVYLNRKLGCLLCHNSAYSASGVDSYWNRTHPVVGSFERALFGNHSGRSPREVQSVFRSDAVSRSGLQVWGMTEKCGRFTKAVSDDGCDPANKAKEHACLRPGEVAWFGNPATAGPIQPKDRQRTIYDVESMLRSGADKLSLRGLRRTVSTVDKADRALCAPCPSVSTTMAPNEQAAFEKAEQLVTATIKAKCQNCHQGRLGGLLMTEKDFTTYTVRRASWQQSNMARIEPRNLNNSYLYHKLLAKTPLKGSRMPLGGQLTPGELAAFKDWITYMPPRSGCDRCKGISTGGTAVPTSVAPDEALAFLVALSVVGDVWTEVMGYPATIANYYPRTQDQLDVLWQLTETYFIRSNWSLRELLVVILSSNYFNQLPPALASGTPYDSPLVFDPWVEADPRRPPLSLGWDPDKPPVLNKQYDKAAHPQNHHNSMTESIQAYRGQVLLNSVHHALGWPKAQRFGQVGYPSTELRKSLGEFHKDAVPGFRGLDFQGLLTWESVHGSCSKPIQDRDDWIDRLIKQAASEDAKSPVTVRELVVTVKDWLLGYGAVDARSVGSLGSEEDALEVLFGVSTLDAKLRDSFGAPFASSGLGSKVRQLCGALLQSPQFLLAGVAPQPLGPEPRLRVCNDSSDCSYRSICNEQLERLQRRGFSFACEDKAIGPVAVPAGPVVGGFPREHRLCPKGTCYAMPVATACLEGLNRNCFEGSPTFLSAATGTERTALSSGRGAVYVALAGGQEVKRAKGVHILAAHAEEAEPLERGRLLEAGDVLRIDPGAKLRIGSRREGFRVADMPARDDGGSWVMVVAEDDAEAPSRWQPEATPWHEIELLLDADWVRWGEAGPPLGNTEGLALEGQDLDVLLERKALVEQMRAELEALSGEAGAETPEETPAPSRSDSER